MGWKQPGEERTGGTWGRAEGNRAGLHTGRHCQGQQGLSWGRRAGRQGSFLRSRTTEASGLRQAEHGHSPYLHQLWGLSP